MCARCCQIACRFSLMFQAAITGRRVEHGSLPLDHLLPDDDPPSGDDLRRPLEVRTRRAARAARMT